MKFSEKLTGSTQTKLILESISVRPPESDDSLLPSSTTKRRFFLHKKVVINSHLPSHQDS